MLLYIREKFSIDVNKVVFSKAGERRRETRAPMRWMVAPVPTPSFYHTGTRTVYLLLTSLSTDDATEIQGSRSGT